MTTCRKPLSENSLISLYVSLLLYTYPSEICKFVVGIDVTVPFEFAEREPKNDRKYIFRLHLIIIITIIIIILIAIRMVY